MSKDAASAARPATPVGPARANAAAKSLTPPGPPRDTERAFVSFPVSVPRSRSKSAALAAAASFTSNAAYALRRSASGTPTFPPRRVRDGSVSREKSPFPEALTRSPATPAAAYKSANAPDPSPAKRASTARLSSDASLASSLSESEPPGPRVGRSARRDGRVVVAAAVVVVVAAAVVVVAAGPRDVMAGARNGRSAAADARGARGARGIGLVSASSSVRFRDASPAGASKGTAISSSGCTSKPSRPRTGSPSRTASNSASPSLRRATGAPTGLLSSSAAYSLANRSVAPKKLTSRIPSTHRAFLGFLCVSLVYVHVQLRGQSILRSGHRRGAQI